MVIEEVTGGAMKTASKGEKLIADANSACHAIVDEMKLRFENSGHLTAFCITQPKQFPK